MQYEASKEAARSRARPRDRQGLSRREDTGLCSHTVWKLRFSHDLRGGHFCEVPSDSSGHTQCQQHEDKPTQLAGSDWNLSHCFCCQTNTGGRLCTSFTEAVPWTSPAPPICITLTWGVGPLPSAEIKLPAGSSPASPCV